MENVTSPFADPLQTDIYFDYSVKTDINAIALTSSNLKSNSYPSRYFRIADRYSP